MAPLQVVLKAQFGKDFPVGEGSTKRDDPLVITDPKDYVSIEYGVAQFLLERMGLEYEFEEQMVHNMSERIVDELVYATREVGESDWTHTRRFFFDITAGFNGRRPGQLEKSGKRGHVFGHSTYVSPPEPSKLRPYVVATLRWVCFLPVAFAASWLATRILMFARLNPQNINPYVALFALQAVSGGVIGWVGVTVAPSAKNFALACCAVLSAVVSLAYFLKFPDLLGGLAAATGLIATIVAGYIARED